MFDNKICIIRSEVYNYPSKEELFRPSNNYSEYFFSELAEGSNPVYGMVRNCLLELGLDEENANTPKWNPLNKYISPGNTVLLKPNMVLESNRIEMNGTDCLITNPSIVACILDYCIKAGGQQSKYIIGDAPLSDCNFDKLIEENGYDKLVNYYKKKGYNVCLADFRNVKINKDVNGLRFQQDKNVSNLDNGVVVRLDRYSAFDECTEERLKKLRVTDYDPRILQDHHTSGHHEYMISKEVLEADVIINLPKPKTHRKAGITAALKNLIGINANKEYLPHHTLGCVEQGGDDFLTNNQDLLEAERYLDERNIFNEEGKITEATEASKKCVEALRKGQKKELYFEGSWYGNDTIWRTIIDLNKILYYSDKSGIMQDTIQRKVFIIGDMIISGSREGPLAPEPLDCGIIIGGEDPLLFDRTVCAIMGFDHTKIPSMNRSEYLDCEPYKLCSMDVPYIISNSADLDGKKLGEIRDQRLFDFVPSFGWQAVLGNSDISRLEKYLVPWDKFIADKSNYCSEREIYIFGASKKGIAIYKALTANGINVNCFVDNNSMKWGTNFHNGKMCKPLMEIEQTGIYIVAVEGLSVQFEIGIQIWKFASDPIIVFYKE